MIAAARRSVLLADAAKFRMNGSVRICGAAELDAVVTDASADEPCVGALARAGVEVVRV
jgi:DeoR family fructose operon transcriptional repressor